MGTKKGKVALNRKPLPVTVLSGYREKGKTYPNQPRLFLTARPPRYREKGKTTPIQTEQLSPCFYLLPRKALINSPQLAGTIDIVDLNAYFGVKKPGFRSKPAGLSE
jgi:hypothetical protein